MKAWPVIAALLLASTAAPVSAEVLYDTGVQTLSLSDPTQLGRLSRNGVPADWSSMKAFPGILNTTTTTTYYYGVFDVPIVDTPYVQITIDSTSANTFLSAYLDSYSASNLALNYLGDAGSSGNYFGTDPISFQVVVPEGHDLVLVLNNTAAGGVGVSDPFDILVEGFIDTEYTDPSPASVPEPAPWTLILGTLAGLAGALALRRKPKSLVS